MGKDPKNVRLQRSFLPVDGGDISLQKLHLYFCFSSFFHFLFLIDFSPHFLLSLLFISSLSMIFPFFATLYSLLTVYFSIHLSIYLFFPIVSLISHLQPKPRLALIFITFHVALDVRLVKQPPTPSRPHNDSNPLQYLLTTLSVKIQICMYPTVIHE